jgi:hypothetical protein
MIIKLKQNLAQAQSRIKKYADKKRVDREFIVGAVVYLKLQPYRHTAFGLHQNLKLTTKYYGPFRVMERIGPSVSYPVPRKRERSLHTCAQDVQITRMVTI